MGWRNFRDRIALLLVIAIPGLWVAQAFIAIGDQAIGASIVGWTMIVQFYFRKAESEQH